LCFSLLLVLLFAQRYKLFSHLQNFFNIFNKKYFFSVFSLV
jgi:hypothetical protein